MVSQRLWWHPQKFCIFSLLSLRNKEHFFLRKKLLISTQLIVAARALVIKWSFSLWETTGEAPSGLCSFEENKSTVLFLLQILKETQHAGLHWPLSLSKPPAFLLISSSSSGNECMCKNVKHSTVFDGVVHLMYIQFNEVHSIWTVRKLHLLCSSPGWNDDEDN